MTNTNPAPNAADLETGIALLVSTLNGFAKAQNYTVTFSAEKGRRYTRIIGTTIAGDRSAKGFVDTTTGAILKADGWKGPAKNFARGNVNTPAKWSPMWIWGIG